MHDSFGSLEIFLQQNRREGQDVANIIKAVAGIVLRKVVGRPEIDAEQVANGVVVFGAIQPPGCDRPGSGFAACSMRSLLR